MAALGLALVLLGGGALFWAPGLVAAKALGVEGRSTRWLGALWLGALLVGLGATALSPLSVAPWLPAVVPAVALLWFGRSGLRADLKLGWAPEGPPLLLLAVVLAYGWLRPDSLAFNTLGLLGPAVEAAGHPLGLGGELPAHLLGRPLPAPLGQLAPVVAAVGVFGQPGVRLWFALVMLLLAGSTFELCRAVGVSRRLATVAAAFAVWNPLTMDANHLDPLTNLLPAAVLGFVLLARRREDLPLWVMTLLLVRPIFVLAVPFLARGDRWKRWLPVAVLPLAVGALPLLGGGPFQLDPGLLPVAGLPELWVWLSPWTRMPFAAAPAWALLPLWTLAGLGSIVLGLAFVGAGRLRRDRPELARTALALMLPTGLLLLACNLALQAGQASRLTLFLVPAVVAAALGLQRVLAERRALLLVAGLAVGLPLLGRATVLVPWPLQTAAYESFPHLLPEPGPWLAQERRRAASAMPWPRWSVEHLIDPWFIGQGKRWRDAAFELSHPSLEWRYTSIDETILSFTKGEAFTGIWLPDHPRLRPQGQERGAGDPYLEQEPLVVAVDLGTALRDGRLRAECRRDDRLEVHLDLASNDGPLAALVRIPGQEATALAAFKEYYGPTQVETALVFSPPSWGSAPDPRAIDLPDGVLRVRVPGRTFLSYAALLGERHDTLELLVGQVFHVALRCEEGVEVFGPFRQ